MATKRTVTDTKSVYKHDVDNINVGNDNDEPKRSPGRPPKKRPKRIPVGTHDVLKFKKRPGYVRRVVNDVDDRIEMFKRAGYEIVKAKDYGGYHRAGDPAPVDSAVTRSVGGGIRGVLMEIPEEWYREDQEAKARKLDELENSIRRKGRDGDDGTYGEIRIGTANRRG